MKLQYLVLILLLPILGCDTTKSGINKPNIVLLFVDDLGWADLGHRNPTFHTPNIDQLKDEGMDFSRFYVPTATCSPSRASLLTGKESARLGLVRHITHEDEITGRNDGEFNYWPKDPVQMPSRNWLKLEEVTYAEVLKDHGYYNMFIGKWHLGHEEFHPIHQGFDEQFGTGNFGHPRNYYAPFFKHANPLPQFTNEEYLTDILTDKAEGFIANYDKDQPFLLNMWYYTVHGPFVGRKDWYEKYKADGLHDKYAKYAAMVTVMDESVGRIRKALDEKGISDNTVILFTSDQGGAFQNGPLRGGKYEFTIGEGGSRVPLLVYYPGKTKAGSVCDVPTQNIDIMPTLVDIASGKSTKIDDINGVSLMPLFNGETIGERNLYFYRSYGDQYAAVIHGDWKLIKYRSGKFELFYLKDDVGETTNLVETESTIAENLKNHLMAWEEEAVDFD